MYLRLIAECYANKCVADKLRELIFQLTEGETLQINVFHKHYMGRDRILKELFKIAKKGDVLQVILIDYERGVARKYVEAGSS